MKRPTSVLVFGVINIIFGALGLCGLIVQLSIQLSGFDQLQGQNNPTLELMQELTQTNPAYELYTQLMMVLGSVMTILILVAGIGLIKLKNWARLSSIGWAVFTIATTIMNTLITFVLVFIPLLDQLTGPERIGIQIGIVFSIIFAFVFFVYSAFMIFKLTRPAIVAAFADDPVQETDMFDPVE